MREWPTQYPKPMLTASNYLLKYLQDIVMKNRKKQEILTFDNLEPGNVL